MAENQTNDYSPTKPTSERAIKQAEKENLDVVFPAANELQIDIDNDDAYATFVANRDIVEKHIGITQVLERPSKSDKPGKKHITVTLKRDVSNLERILLQATLGSDRKREILSYIQELNSGPHPTLFLEKKQLLLAAAATA